MNTSTLFFISTIVMALFLPHYSFQVEQDNTIKNNPDHESQESRDSYTGSSRFLGPKKHARYETRVTGDRPRDQLTCDKYPRVCHVKGTLGHDCCKKKCVNVKKDNLNCGMCGLKCRSHEICCNGKCINPMNDKNNCGGCHNKCHIGSLCYYGMCNYA
ncbi:hypothetical protein RND81_06G137100 [Saponaria officinalis]|uniref:Stigma-specific STIG1-like protein 1 n=1 Tax=Saponaria officinalis TaxID=3572 RepID=A0AAW1K6H1_SAPOF